MLSTKASLLCCFNIELGVPPTSARCTAHASQPSNMCTDMEQVPCNQFVTRYFGYHQHGHSFCSLPGTCQHHPASIGRGIVASCRVPNAQQAGAAAPGTDKQQCRRDRRKASLLLTTRLDGRAMSRCSSCSRQLSQPQGSAPHMYCHTGQQLLHAVQEACCTGQLFTAVRPAATALQADYWFPCCCPLAAVRTWVCAGSRSGGKRN